MPKQKQKKKRKHKEPDPAKRLAAMPSHKKFLLLLSYWALMPFILVLQRLRPDQLYTMAKAIAEFLWFISPKRRLATLRTLEIAMGEELTPMQRERVARHSYRHFLYNVMDLMLVSRAKRNPQLMQRIEVHPKMAEYANDGVPTLILCGHLGGWEAGALGTANAGANLFPVYRPLDHPLFDRELADLRSYRGAHPIPRWGALRMSLGVLKGPNWVALMADQNGGIYAAFVNFFGVAAATEVALFPLLKKQRVRVIFSATIRHGEEFRFTVLEPEVFHFDDALDGRTDAMRLGQWYMDQLEAVIRQHPEQYAWIHRRFKSRPDKSIPALYNDIRRSVSPEELAAQPSAPILPKKWRS